MSGESILIVEDESVVALNVSHIIQSLGYRPIGPIATGSGALKLLDEEVVDLVLMDIKLKGRMDGIELAKRINSIRPVPIVFLTAYTDERTLSRAKVTEPFGYITKSFDEGELHSTIEMALYKFKMEQKLVREERLLATTLDNILEGVITTDVEGKIRYMNSAAERLLGAAFAEASGRKLESFVMLHSSDGKLSSPLEIRTEAESNDTLDPGKIYTVLCKRNPSEPGPPVEWKTKRINPFENRDAEIVHVVRDLTTRLRGAAAQRRLVSVVEYSDDAIITVTPSAVIDSWNAGAEKVFGYAVGEALEKDLSIIVPRFVPLDLGALVARVGEGESIDPFEMVCVRKGGELVDVTIKLQRVKDFTGTVPSISLIARDVTARKNLDKKLREILNREQTRIGQDLHDSIGQMITGVLFKTKALEHMLQQKQLGEEVGAASDIKEILTSTLVKLRELARGLIPATILSDGLVFALRRLAQDTESLCGVPVGFVADGGADIADELVSAEVYHIVEEALNNAVKHSGCRRVTVTVQSHHDAVVVSVADNGRGIPSHSNDSGLGLKIMRHRAELIGAIFSIDSGTTGTRVVCRLPISVELE